MATSGGLRRIFSNKPTGVRPNPFDFEDVLLGPGIEEDDAAYDEFLASGEAGRAREEKRSLENILGGLQGRGLATSGIAVRDAFEQIVGPSAERARSLAATFGLERARRRSDILQSMRDTANEFNLAKLTGAQNFAIGDRQNQIEAQRAREERKRRRRGGIAGVIGGGIGAALGGPTGAYVGYQAGNNIF